MLGMNWLNIISCDASERQQQHTITSLSQNLKPEPKKLSATAQQGTDLCAPQLLLELLERVMQAGGACLSSFTLHALKVSFPDS